MPHSPDRRLARCKHIVVEGPIGVGKSSLARTLAEYLGADLLLEQAEENPFLGRFYEDMAGHAFQTQLFFLTQRVKQMQSASQPGMFPNGVVSDFLFAKDALFARMNLSDDEHRLYMEVSGQIVPQVSEPDLVIWLQASPETLMERIRTRGIGIEQRITLDYLQRLCDAYAAYFHAYEGAPMFAVGTEHLNPVDREADFALLIERMAAFRGTREFFNSRIDTPPP